MTGLSRWRNKRVHGSKPWSLFISWSEGEMGGGVEKQRKRERRETKNKLESEEIRCFVKRDRKERGKRMERER
jgi:hypothetical protein